MTLNSVLLEVAAERTAQDEKFGEQNHPDGTDPSFSTLADAARVRVDASAQVGRLTWREILLEEVWEAMSEADRAALRIELLQVAAVAVAWVEKLDREDGR